MKLVVSVLLAGILVVPAARADYAAAVQAYDHGDYKTALSELRPLAEQGDAKAQVRLGLMYREGRGVPRDSKSAFAWLLRAARAGRADAQYLVGTMYQRGDGTAADATAANAWLRRSAEQGNKKAAAALNDAGQSHRKAKTAAQSKAKAATVNTRANREMTAELAAETESLLAAMDPPASAAEIAAINKAAAHGIKVRYGALSANTREKSAEETPDRDGMNFQPTSAPTSLQEVLGKHLPSPADLATEIAAPDKPAVNDRSDVESERSVAAKESGASMQEASNTTAATLQQEAARGNAVAQRRLAGMYQRGEGVPRDAVQAAQWYRKAALNGDAESQFLLSGLYARGAGVPRDSGVAVQWLRRAAAQGHVQAQSELSKLQD